MKYCATKDEKLYNILYNTTCELLKQQDADGRICTYSYDKEFTFWDLWCRKYVMLGLEYFYSICRDETLKEKLLNALKGHADYIIKKIGPNDNQKGINQASGDWYGMNSSSILEPFVRLYKMSGEKRYFDFSSYIVDCGGMSEANIFELAYEGKLYPYQYPATKAYEMMSCFEGLLEYYRVTGIEKWKQAVINFVGLVAKSDITIIGTAGCTQELFDNSAVRQFEFNKRGIMQETCVTVTWMKLCWQLLRLTGDCQYADYIEKSMYNAMLGSVNTEHCNENGGMVFDSYSPIVNQKRGCGMGGIRILNLFNFFGCCAAIGAAGVGLMGVFPIMQYEDGIVFNTYVDGKVAFNDKNGKYFSAVISTEYPKNRIVEIEIKEAQAVLCRLRIPGFSKETSLYLNGAKIDCTTGYADIVVNTGDKIVLIFDMKVRVISSEEFGSDEDFVAFSYGPLVLAMDSRLSERLNEPVGENFDVEKTNDININANIAFEVKSDLCEFILIDYASAGKTWNNDSKLSVWLHKN